MKRVIYEKDIYFFFQLDILHSTAQFRLYSLNSLVFLYSQPKGGSLWSPVAS